MRTLQQAVQSGEYSDYQQYAELVNKRLAATLRDSLALNPGDEAASIDDDVNLRLSCLNASTPLRCPSAH